MPATAAHQDRGLGGLCLPHPTQAHLCPASPSRPPTFLHHADGQALLEAAELAAVSPPLVHRAVLVSQADVLGIFLHCTLDGGATRNRLSESGGRGGQGRGPSRSCCHHRQKHSLFTAIFLTFGWQGRERWRGGVGGGRRKSWGHWGRFMPKKGDPQDTRLGPRGSGLHSSPDTWTSQCAFPGAGEGGQRRAGGWGREAEQAPRAGTNIQPVPQSAPSPRAPSPLPRSFYLMPGT